MAGRFSPFGGTDESDLYDDYGEFVPEHVPEPGPFLDGHRILTGDEHVTFHERTRDVFEERTVYDTTFNYNLARLNLDTRHEDAGFRYAVETGDSSVLRAEFTPTTPFCPQSHTLALGAFRAWNGLSDRHDFDLVRVRVSAMHQQSDAINEQLAALETRYLDTGTVPDASTDLSTVDSAMR
ncbi:hypothetical protein GJR96_15465 [Haloferax sp. MBLA0076]|uniref:DUF7998 domain-containing protein n=1 Tax=Haloferax litoreum TaxID=2666140 RepID=A0A6A8GNB2_9EURY|nr:MULTISPECIES: hypothetical protein [Haloferax]KAB1190380.1 hypothetical protein Hfx1148_15390 [Haloferax sp. CBA1148]MRX23350.1 hypothetical protein [Haloferax litoreum]